MRFYVFDVGETLVDETRLWGRHADRLGIRRLTFFGVLGALIAADRHHRDVFAYFGVDADRYLADLARLDDPADGILLSDFYPDAAPTMAALRQAGHSVAVAGNQPERAAQEIEALGIELDFVATSASWGLEKPSPEFFARVIAASGAAASEITYVGDRLDNDVLPATDAGMDAVLIRRGPWGHLHAARSEASHAVRIIDSLAELIE